MRNRPAHRNVGDCESTPPVRAAWVRDDGIAAIPALFRGWHADVVQLGRGPQDVCGIHIPLGDFALTCMRLRRKVLFRATAPRDWTALLTAPVPSPPVWFRSHRIEGEHFLAVGRGARLELIVPESASLLVVRLGARSQNLRNGGLPLPPEGRVEMRRMPAEPADQLAKCQQYLAQLWPLATGMAEVPRLQAGFAELAAAAVGGMANAASSFAPAAGRTNARRQAVARACAYIDSHLGRPLALRELCRAAGVGTRTLEYGFREVFDLGPMTYLRSIRLSRVYRDLADHRNADETVTGAAIRWCFTHMGQFSKDYRIQFGENPSATLKRGRVAQDGGRGKAAWGEGGQA